MSLKYDIEEAAAIIGRAIDLLMRTASTHTGRQTSDLRRTCGALKANAEQLLADNAVAQPLGKCFELARLAGASLPDMENVRRQLRVEQPASLTATAVAQACVLFCLENEALIIADTRFTSRQDVERVQQSMREAFAQAAEGAANVVESTAYMTITALGGAVTFFLYDRARPLPQMVRFQFVEPGPTLVYAYRLYANAARADELRAENKVVHPAFCRRTGVALSA